MDDIVMLRLGNPGMCPVKVSQVLGRGKESVVFLAHLNGNKCALRVQDVTQPADLELSNRQLHLYDQISKMRDEDSVFFTKAYCYIASSRDHVMTLLLPIRGFDIEKELPRPRTAKNYSLILTEYKGETTLARFMEKRSRIPYQLIYSLILQIAKIVLVLAAKGYSHNDLHTHNIMINKTDRKTFTLNGKKIKYHGYQLSAIDYGLVLHKKYVNQRGNSLPFDFVNDRKRWIFDELSTACFPVLVGQDRMIAACIAQSKTLPWGGPPDAYQRACNKMFRKEPHYCLEKIQQFLRIFPDAKLSYAALVGMNTDTPARELTKALIRLFTSSRQPPPFWAVITRVADLYVLDYPDGAYDFGWCSPAKSMVPRELLEELQVVKTTGAYVKAVMERLE